MKNKHIQMIFVVMVLSMMFSVASAAQTSFECSVLDGYAQIQSDSRSNTVGSSDVYDMTKYRLDVRSLLGNSEFSIASNSDEAIETVSQVSYSPSAFGLTGLFLSEEVHTSRIQKGELSSCCESSVKTSAVAETLNYESLASLNSNELLFNLNANGSGSIGFQAQEAKVTGVLNGSWTETRSSDAFDFYGSSYDVSLDYMFSGCDYPASATESTPRLCPFFSEP